MDSSDPDAIGRGAELEATINQTTNQQSRPEETRSDRDTHTNLSHSIDENDISLRGVDPVNVHVHNLSVSVDISPSRIATLFKTKNEATQNVKTILDDVSAEMPTGTLTAIIGSSGSGKTSMLNVMSQRMHGRRLAVSGSVLYNGSQDLSSIRSAYVMQQDVLIPTLTVRETLKYAADLRFPSSVSKEERHRVVEEVIIELGLKEAANTRIGNSTHKGCSGGEKRRTSIGVQMLANPSVLFLDEPTTGLDATSAFQLIRTLKHLAKKGRTIITTIHQPRSEIWSLFDRIILLTKGSPAYSGATTDCLPYFAELGYVLPPFINPAEYLIDIVAIDSRSEELEKESSDRVEAIRQAWRNHSSDLSEPKDEKALLINKPAPEKRKLTIKSQSPSSSCLQQTQVLTRRTFIVTIRDPMGVMGSLVEVVGISVICGWIFLDLDGSQTGIRSRLGALYNASSLQGYLILLYEIYRLTSDIQLFDRERGEGVVGIFSFLFSRRLARAVLEDIPVPLIFSIIYYFMVGFRADGGQFLTFFSICLILHFLCMNLAMVCIALSRNFAGASLIANLIYTLQSMACGYFITANSMPIYVRWTKWTAYLFYAFGALTANEFVGHFYDCPEEGGPDNPECKPWTGEFIMESIGMPDNWVWRPIIVLVAFTVAFFIGAGLILRFFKSEMIMSRPRATDTDDSAGKEILTARSNHGIRTVNIRLDEYALEIEKRKWWGTKAANLSILKPVTAEFQAGVLNVIMGSSGSGKTSLLNLMTRRLTDNFTTKYHPSGRMLINGAIPSESVVQSICSFVTQDDDALLPSLTVRETLRFAAGLRLPSWMSKEEKTQRAESVLLKMGLKDCADNLIGGELVKGISGGEKRRVTIAVQILTDPRVLLLDEPTSGLDAFTASSIIEVLKGLADEGRTLILTIHQSRSDLFPQFGNVLLLARGGSPVYAGPGSGMLSHFQSRGYECPRTTNPADFALDLITVDLQHEKKEAISREKVRNLIEGWTPDKFPMTTNASIATPAQLGSLQRSMTSFKTAFPILVRRSMINFWRQPPVMIARIMQVVGIGIVVSVYFAPLKNDYYAIQNRLGFIQELAPLYFVGMLQNVAVYPSEKDVFYREHDDRAYGVEAFFLQYTAIEVPFEIISSLILAVLADIACGLPRTVKMFFIVAYNCFCVISCGESLGIMFNTFFTHTGFAVNVTSIFISFAQIMSGVMSLDIPSFLQAWNHLSPVKYFIVNLAVYSLKGEKFHCNDAQRLPNGGCPIETGEQVLDLYNLDKDPKVHMIAIGICAVVYRFLAYSILKAKKGRWHWRFWKSR
ncbi:ABC transporter-like protein [Patellaria atrata CBS 101060]|uniref:ABC transporter-like protein n=1 Tax=Patellaria atrata CBS 101060 TaxID=1346257 RepID=A0A9P4S270_9PEZI|nr:ABC transporter-like protein [Patellaria atrata CBS 101060]